MRVHITNIYGQAQHSVAQIVQNQVCKGVRDLGFHEIGFYYFDIYSDSHMELSRRLDGIMSGVSWGDTVIYQSPSWNSREYDFLFMAKLKALDAKIITFIHDVPPMMFAESNYYLMPEYIELYNNSHVVIVPSERMKDKLIEEGLNVPKILVQKLWDNPHDYFLHMPRFEKRLSFAGNLERFPHLANWSYSVPLEVYSVEDVALSGTNIVNKGWRNGTELLIELSKGGLGLVWGNSEKPEDEKEYYKMNVSHKVSSYLSAGIPVVVPSYLSNADLIREHGLGYVADSLEEANAFVENLTEEAYQQMVGRVRVFADLLKDMYFTKKILLDAVIEASL